MNRNNNGKSDRFAIALGVARLASPYVGLTIVAHDHINAAWDEKLGARPDEAESGDCPARSRMGWAT